MKYRLEWEFKAKTMGKIMFTSDFLEGETALQAAEELEKTGKAGEITFIDEIGTIWNVKEMKKLLAEVEEEPHDLRVYFDGGFQKETYKAGLGIVVYYKQGKKKYRLRTNHVFDELETNNEAEYAALYYSLTILEELGVRNMSCEFIGDSQGVLKQLEGEWPCYEDTLNRWLDRIENKIKELGLYPKYSSVSRNENKEADKLAAQALQGKMINSKMQIL
ncbi:reverse transcriptase-like protein [Bacillus sp. REN3]|uniref:reverse transcriptase-like protein n=1 Tax=Bacillus sp. REN3 TaxID=2802440 RepID=UPI001AED3217|nr:reverse transcriptase-like protein [Bacillus sp. REN3]